MKEIKVQEALAIAIKNTPKSPLKLSVIYKGELNGKYLFNYNRNTSGGGHFGKPLYATVSKSGDWRMVEDDKELTEAIIFVSSTLRKSP